jgi:hypothetical protein
MQRYQQVTVSLIMEDHFKVCGNCGHCTMLNGEFVCIDPKKPQQEVVPMGARRPCFIVTPLTRAQLQATGLMPAASRAIH